MTVSLLSRSAIQSVRPAVRAVAALAVAATVLAGCGSGTADPPGAATTSASGDANPNAVVAQALPEDAVDRAVERLDGLVASLQKSTGIPGISVAVVHGDKTVYAKGFGVRELGTDHQVDADTVFPLASMSKPIGATVLAKLVTDKVITWDLPIRDGLPDFALSDPWVTRHVTVADMYAHRSGLPDHAGDKIEDLGYDRAQAIHRLRFAPLSPFRISYAYTNFGVTAGAEAAARKAGMSWEDLSDKEIYRPLGMARTSSRFADFEGRADRVVGHVRKDGAWARTPKQRDPDTQSPAGGVSSSANDVAKWMSMVLGNGTVGGKQIVGADALLPAVSPQIISAPPATPSSRAGAYGYGFNTSVTEAGRTQISHAGAFAMGAATNFLILPSAKVGIVVLSNAAPIGAVDALSSEFADLVQFGEVRNDWRKLYGDAYADMLQPVGSLVDKRPPANPAPSQPLTSFVGTYRNDVYGPAQIRDDNGKLVLALGPEGSVTHELAHWDGDTFTFGLNNENALENSISKVTFENGRMVIEYYDDEMSDGVFVKS